MINIKKMIATLFFGFTTLGFMPIVSCSQTQNTIQKVNLISTNDIHGRLISNTKNKEAGIQAINGYINKQEYDLLLDGGDLIQGTSLNDIDKGNTIAKITSLMNYDALAVGNHEFDFGLENILNIANKVQKNFLSANTRYLDSNNHVFTSSKIKTLKNNLKVGIVGLTTEETAYKTHPKNIKNLIFTKIANEAKTEIDKLEKEGINFIVLVSHIGEYETIPLAKELNDKIDLIVDGHSHQNFISKVGTTYIIQTGEYTKALRNTELEFNSQTGFIEKFSSNLIEYDDLIKYENEANQEVIKLISELKQKENEEFNKVVVENSPYFLDGERNNVRHYETNLGNLVTDAMFWKTQQAINNLDFAITNSGGIRSSLQKGKITKKDTHNVFPFGNNLVAIEAKGSVIKKMFDRSVENNNGSGALLQISSNVRLKQLNDLNWIYEIKEQNSFKEIENDKTYRFALPDFTYAGGDGYSFLTSCKEIFSGMDIKIVLEEYLMKIQQDNEWEKYSQTAPKSRILFKN